jgi:DNA-binding Lrp family transcriptional regulator
MARRRMVVADSREILVQWDAGEEVSRIARQLGYSRPTVRKSIRAAEQAGLTRGQRPRAEADWDQLAAAAIAQVAHQRPLGAVRQDVARLRLPRGVRRPGATHRLASAAPG